MLKPPFTNRYSILYNVDENGVATSYGSRQITFNSGSFTSVSTPGWPPRAGTPFGDNPFSYSISTESREEGSFGGYYGSVFTGWVGNAYNSIESYAMPLQLLPADDTASKALSSLHSKVKDMSVNVVQTFAERKQTVGMIAKRIEQVAQAAMALKKGKLLHAANILGVEVRDKRKKKFKRFRSARQNADDFGNLWLEYSYGWRPLLQDIHGAIKQLEKSFDTNKPLVVVGSSQYNILIKQNVRAGSYEGGGKTSFYNEVADGQMGLKTRYVARFAISSVKARELAQSGVSNPALLAWELLPYSFVVDWFIPVGNYLSAMDSCNGLQFLNGTVSTRTYTQYTTNWQNKTALPWHLFVRGCGRSVSITTKSRTPLGFMPMPSLPSPTASLSVSQITSALALLQQTFKR